MKELIKSFFGASGKEITGLSLLIIVLVLSWFIPQIINLLSPHSTRQVVEDQQLLDSLVLLLEKNKPLTNVVRTFELHPFDPNLVTYNELISLGFKQSVAGRIVKYRNKGGSFKIKNDLYKIYEIDSGLVSDLLDYIDLPATKTSPGKTSRFYAKSTELAKGQFRNDVVMAELPMFDLNKADTSMLQTINGIGSVLSTRIVYYRTRLGGFVSTDQLFAIYNLDSVVVDRLISKVFIENGFSPEPIMINQFTKDSLAVHPYLSWQQARLIIAYRNQHGAFLSGDDLLKVYSIEEKDVQKILPYISWATTY